MIANPNVIYDAEAEKAVLGCCLAQPNEVIDEIQMLSETDFFVPAHQDVFRVILEMFYDKKPIEMRLVHDLLEHRKIAERVGSPGILAELLVGFATHLNVLAYANRVKDKSLLRQLQSACAAIVRDIAENPENVPDLLARSESAICRVTTDLKTNDLLSAERCVQRYETWRGKIQRGEIEPRLRTGLRVLDETNGGMPVPSYVVLAGEQGVGKSALILTIMKNGCLNGMGIGGFSAEMTVEQCISRMVGDMADINTRRLNGKLHPEEEEHEAYAVERIRKMPFIIDERSGLRPQDLRSGTRRMVKAGCKLIWLDNAQLMIGTRNEDQRVQQLTEVSRTIQHLQKEHGIVFILLCQVTREGQKRGNLRAFDLADCAAFERDARVMVMLEKMPLKEGQSEPPAYSTPIIARVVKYSEGETGDFEVTFNKEKQRIQ